MAESSYITLAGIGEGEYEEKKSVFIGRTYPVESEEEAQALVKAQKKEFHDARHSCYAYILKDGITKRFSDDGEPQGSAGLPMLNVLEKKGIVGVLAVVTRYFGGTLLGVGGLVRAYTEATVLAVESAGTKKYEKFKEMSVCLSYSDYQKIGNILREFTLIDENTEFTDSVSVSFSILSGEEDRLIPVLNEAGNGRWKITVGCEKWGFREL